MCWVFNTIKMAMNVLKNRNVFLAMLTLADGYVFSNCCFCDGLTDNLWNSSALNTAMCTFKHVVNSLKRKVLKFIIPLLIIYVFPVQLIFKDILRSGNFLWCIMDIAHGEFLQAACVWWHWKCPTKGRETVGYWTVVIRKHPIIQ